jgi:hypothetical protein
MSSHIIALLPPVNDVTLADRHANAFKLHQNFETDRALSVQLKRPGLACARNRNAYLTVDLGAVSDNSNHRPMVGGSPPTFE